jgi:DNA invertase Pin-like site-specific DNA recombinase
MTVALYARVSTSDQDCSLQLSELREHCLKRKWEIFKEYTDHAVSGGKNSRPALDALREDAAQLEFAAVVVWKLDRWGRSLAHCIVSIQELSSLGIRFIAIRDAIDTGDDSHPGSRLMLHLIACFAEYEREMIRERVRAGVKSAKARGVRFGRPKRIFDKEAAEKMRLGRMSVRKIALALGVTKGAIQRFIAERKKQG